MNISRTSLQHALSAERLLPYLDQAQGDIKVAWSTYRWNLDLVGAIMPLISDVEVTLRNTIHIQLTQHFDTAQWWSNPRLLLDDDTREMMSSIVRRHRKKLKSGSEGPGRVLADVTFRVWINMLSRGSVTAMQQRVDYEANLWRKAIMYGFQVGNDLNARGLPKRPIRRHVHDAAANLQALRNAAGHHRRISEGIRQPGRPPETPRIPLADLSRSGIELLGWMSPDLVAFHNATTTLDDVLASRPVL